MEGGQKRRRIREAPSRIGKRYIERERERDVERERRERKERERKIAREIGRPRLKEI